MGGEQTPKRPSNMAFRWQILASFSPLVLLVRVRVHLGTLVSAVFVEALALASAVSSAHRGTRIGSFLLSSTRLSFHASAAFWLGAACPLSVLCLRYSFLIYGLTHQKSSCVIRY